MKRPNNISTGKNINNILPTITLELKCYRAILLKILVSKTSVLKNVVNASHGE